MNSFTRTVLVVEDTGLCAATLEIALGQISGVEVVVANSAEQARQYVSSTGVSAVLTDLNLPKGSGLELISWIRQQKQRIPIIVISGETDPEAPARSLQAGADAYFGKPFSPTLVKRKLEALLDV